MSRRDRTCAGDRFCSIVSLRMPPYDAVVSYSHHDAALVEPVVQLMRFGGRNVFWDRDIEPGERWAATIEEAIRNAGTLAVLWCCRAARSQEVQAEIELARRQEKGFLPVLLCSYRLREPLDEYQWIDCRKMDHECDGHENEPPRGDGLRYAELIQTEMGSSAEDWARTTINKEQRASVRFAIIGLVGAVLAALAVLRPFPSTLSSTAALVLNAEIAILGLLFFVYAVLSARGTRIAADAHAIALAATIESLIRRAERGESGRARAYTST